MNSISGLVALLEYIDQLSEDLQGALKSKPKPNKDDVAARRLRITGLLADAASDLDALTKAIGHENGGGQETAS